MVTEAPAMPAAPAVTYIHSCPSLSLLPGRTEEILGPQALHPHLHLLPPSCFPGHCVAWGLTLRQMP